MLGMVAVIAYLLGHDAKQVADLRLRATFSVNPQNSPQLVWRNVPPVASSLAVIVKDANTHGSKKQNYYWVVYNLPTDENKLPFGVSNNIVHRDLGFNTWNTDTYRAPAAASKVKVELFALDKRLDAKHQMTGYQLEKKIQGHVLAKAVLVE